MSRVPLRSNGVFVSVAHEDSVAAESLHVGRESAEPKQAFLLSYIVLKYAAKVP